MLAYNILPLNSSSSVENWNAGRNSGIHHQSTMYNIRKEHNIMLIVWGIVKSYRSLGQINHLTRNGHYIGRTAQLISRWFILCIYSTNIRTEYFKHAV